MPKTVDLARIYRATIETFTERGYRAASTKEIAARAGLGVGGIEAVDADEVARVFLDGHGGLSCGGFG